MVSTEINVKPEVSNLIEVERNPDQNSKHTFQTVTLTISPKKQKNVVTTKESGRPEALPTVITVPGASTSHTHKTQSQPFISVMPTSSGETSSARASQEQLSDLSLATFHSWINNTALLCQRDDTALHPAVIKGLASFHQLSQTHPDIVARWKATLVYEKSYLSHIAILGHYFRRLLDQDIRVDRETQTHFVSLSNLTTSTTT
ncbi:hypothetical protein BS17DRAFT_769880 [Gyrodon lividus]|nr:hypothetical protein BS17DRAFT_769880 [Gyrodon lividus]